MATHINEGEITLVLRERVPCRRHISAISGVHVRAGAVQAGAPLLFGEVMVLREGGRLCLRGQRGRVAARGLLPPRHHLIVQGGRLSHKAASGANGNCERCRANRDLQGQAGSHVVSRS